MVKGSSTLFGGVKARLALVAALSLTCLTMAAAPAHAASDAMVVLTPNFPQLANGTVISTNWGLSANVFDSTGTAITGQTIVSTAGQGQQGANVYVNPGDGVTYTYQGADLAGYTVQNGGTVTCEVYHSDGTSEPSFKTTFSGTTLVVPGQYTTSGGMVRCTFNIISNDPSVSKKVRMDGGTGAPTATTEFSRSGRTTTPYRQEAAAAGSKIQYDLVVGDAYNTFASPGGITISDVLPAELTNPTIVGSYNDAWANTGCASVNYDPATRTVSGSVDYVLGDHCHIIVEATLTSAVTGMNGFDNSARITVPAAVPNTTANDVSGQNVSTYSPARISCASTTIYSLGLYTNTLYSINTTTGAMNAVGAFPSGDILNGLAIGVNANSFWAFSQTANAPDTGSYVYKYDPFTGTSSKYSIPLTAAESSTIVGGSIRPDGIYFLQGSTIVNGATYLTLYAFDTNTNTYIGKVGEALITLPAGATANGTGYNGDIAFDVDGNLYYTTETDATGYNAMTARWEGPIPTAPGSTLPASTTVALLNTSFENNGIAFTGSGMLYVSGYASTSSNQNQFSEIDTATASVNWSRPAELPVGRSVNDLASCSYPSTIAVGKVFTARTQASDDVKVTASSEFGELVNATTGDASGNGLSTVTSGSVLGTDGATYTFAESAVGATDLANYYTTYKCVDNLRSGVEVKSGVGVPFTYTLPETGVPSRIVCTITNSPQGISLTKSVSPTTGVTPGQTVTYTFHVVNTGTVEITDIGIDETSFSGSTPMGPIDCGGVTSLAAGASVDCTAQYVVTDADAVAQSVTNTATASGMTGGNPIVSGPSSAVVLTEVPTEPAISLEKSVSPTTVAQAGDSVTYTFHVTNTGDVALTDVAVTEASFSGTGSMSAVDCGGVTTLDVGASVDCTATYAVTQADVDAGEVLNSATASGTDGTDTVTSDPSSAVVTATSVTPVPAVSLEKAVSPATVAKAGDSVTYTFHVTNTGNVALTDVAVTETAFSGTGSMSAVDCGGVTTLDVGASVDCMATYAATQADIDAGQVTNTATASGTAGTDTVTSDPSSAVVTATPVVPAPGLSLQKSVSPTSVTKVGESMTYTFHLVNTGNVALTGVVVTETAFSGTGSLSAVDCGGVTSLEVGASLDCTATYVTTQADVDAGQLTNSATASGSAGDKTVTSDTSSVVAKTPGYVSLITVITGIPTKGAQQVWLAAAGVGVILAGCAAGVGYTTLRRRTRKQA